MDRRRARQHGHRQAQRVPRFGRPVPGHHGRRGKVERAQLFGHDQQRRAHPPGQFADQVRRRIGLADGVVRAQHHQVVQRGMARDQMRRRTAAPDPVPRHVFFGEPALDPFARFLGDVAVIDDHLRRHRAVEIGRHAVVVGDGLDAGQASIALPRQIQGSLQPRLETIVIVDVEQDRAHRIPLVADGGKLSGRRETSARERERITQIPGWRAAHPRKPV